MDLDLNADDQDKVVFMCITDERFLSRVMRRDIEPRHFSSSIRQQVFRSTAEYFEEYKKEPSSDILTVIERKIEAKKIREDDAELVTQYLMKVFSMPNFNPDFLDDTLDLWVKKRIAATTLNELLRLQDRFNIDPDKPLEIMRNALADSDNCTGEQVVEDLLYDPIENLRPREIVTKFGIKPLDKALKGGLKRGSYVVLQAYTGVGKSWCVNHLAKMAVRYGHSVLVVPTEMPNTTAKLRFRMSFTGLTDDEVYEQLGEVKNKTRESMLKGARILLLSEEEKGCCVDRIPSIVEEEETRRGCKIPLLIFDSADDLRPPSGSKFEKDISANTAIHVFLKNYAKNTERCIITTAQVKRIGETKFWLGPADVGDNIEKFRKATVGISISSLKENPAEQEKGLMRLWLCKATDGPTGLKMWMKNDFKHGQFVTKYGMFPGSKEWDLLVAAEQKVERD